MPAWPWRVEIAAGVGISEDGGKCTLAISRGPSGGCASDCGVADYAHLRQQIVPLTAGSPEVAALAEQLLSSHRFVQNWTQLVENQAFDCYFLVDRMWERLVPSEWQACLAAATTAELAVLPTGIVPRHWPDSLHSFVRQGQAAQLDPFPAAAAGGGGSVETEGSSIPAKAEDEAGGPKNRKAVMQRWHGATPKKRDEIRLMGRCIATQCALLKVGTVVDIGSGKGYLSSLLALECELRVVAAEGSRAISLAAADRLRQIRKARGGVGAGSSGSVSTKYDLEANPLFLTVRIATAAAAAAAAAAAKALPQERSSPGTSATCAVVAAAAAAVPTAAPASAGAAGSNFFAAAAAQEVNELLPPPRMEALAADTLGGRGGASSGYAATRQLTVKEVPAGSTATPEVPEGLGAMTLPTLLRKLGSPPAVLVGLHACGDLTANACRSALCSVPEKQPSHPQTNAYLRCSCAMTDGLLLVEYLAGCSLKHRSCADW